MTVVAFQPVGKQAMPDDLLGPEESWHPATVRWWDRWASSPLVGTWTAVDWSEFEACAVLHHEFMKKRTFTLASEIRLRMQKFGATPEDRSRLGIEISSPTPGEATLAPTIGATVSSMAAARRDRVLAED